MAFTFVPPKRTINRVFIHHSGVSDPNYDVEDARRFHVSERGWRDVGYHFFIKTDGEIQAGRPLWMAPAAQRGHNAGTIAICLNGRAPQDKTLQQFTALRIMAKTIAVAIPGVTFHGHNEVAATECPGFDYRAVLELDPHGRLRSGQIDLEDLGDEDEAPVELRQGDRGESVRALQLDLNKVMGISLAADGVFGPKTRRALEGFQRVEDIPITGVLDAKTRLALEAEYQSMEM